MKPFIFFIVLILDLIMEVFTYDRSCHGIN